MTGADLKAWRDRLDLTNAEAAWYLGLTVQGWYDQLYGHRPVSERTAHLCRVIEYLMTERTETAPA